MQGCDYIIEMHAHTHSENQNNGWSILKHLSKHDWDIIYELSKLKGKGNIIHTELSNDMKTWTWVLDSSRDMGGHKQWFSKSKLEEMAINVYAHMFWFTSVKLVKMCVLELGLLFIDPSTKKWSLMELVILEREHNILHFYIYLRWTCLHVPYC